MKQTEIRTVTTVYEHLLQEDWKRDWGELDNHLYSLSQLDDDQLSKEVVMQLVKHEKTPPKCIMDHNHAVGNCVAVAVMAAARALNRTFKPGDVFTKEERYIIEHYLAQSHMAK